ncbi:putative defense protein 3 [Centruroides sculpturatus]|nr:putative defense protein 3 [Centruroides sculpturatus]
MSVDISLFALIVLCAGAGAFPQGATAETCESMIPRHVTTKPSKNSNSPYTFVASSNHYNETSKKIIVDLGGAPFKGFLIAAIDPVTNERIGTWLKSQGMDTLPCSAVTHTNARPKISATLIWTPPSNKKIGEVIFLGTIVRSFDTYYSNLLAAIPADGFYLPRFK